MNLAAVRKLAVKKFRGSGLTRVAYAELIGCNYESYTLFLNGAGAYTYRCPKTVLKDLGIEKFTIDTYQKLAKK